MNIDRSFVYCILETWWFVLYFEPLIEVFSLLYSIYFKHSFSNGDLKNQMFRLNQQMYTFGKVYLKEKKLE